MYLTDAPTDQNTSLPEGATIENAIAIVGMSCRFAGARDIDTYWDMLKNGLEGIERYSDEDLVAAGVDPALLANPHYIRAGAPLADMECFDAGLFGLSPRDAAIMDPQHRHFLECAWEALENAGQIPDQLSGAVGVFGGTGHNAYLFRNLLSNPKLVRDVGPFLLRHTSNDKDFLSTRVSYLLDLKGPSVNIQTACSTSLVAIHSAVQSLLNMECDMALAGAASIELPHRQGYLYEEGEITSADGHCRPFEADSTGAVFGSGVGVVVLRRLEDALEDNDHIYAVIRGSAVNNDGSGKVSYLSPSVDGHAGVVSEALDISDVDARSIDYVEAHGTGTRVGDPIEIAALSQAYRRHTQDNGYCRIGSVKGNIGHTDTAAGVASVIKVALAMQSGFIPPTLHYRRPNPACDFPNSPFEVAGQLQPWTRNGIRPRRAGVSSLGVGGTNAHIIMEEPPLRRAGSASRPWQFFTLSGQSSKALAANAAALADHLEKYPNTNLADAAYTLSTARKALPLRHTVVVKSAKDAVAALRQPIKDRKSANINNAPDVSFMFCGAGAQYAGMGAELYQTEPVFRSAIDDCLGHLSQFEGATLKQWLHPDEAHAAQAEDALQRPSIALPLLFSVQIALARVWMAWGIAPKGMIGHSSGEYAAAYLAGVLSLPDALNIVRTRGQLFETLPEGGMLSIPLSEADVLELLPPELSIAAINAPKLVVVSGPVPQIEALSEQLAQQEVETQRVSIAVAAHSVMLEPILEPFRQTLSRVTFRAPTIPFVSNLTGDWITTAQATDPEYWVRHLRQPVRFTDGLSRLLENSGTVLLEVGPGRVMSSLARQHPDRSADQPVLNSMRHKAEQSDSDLSYILNNLGNLWSAGVTPDWDAYWSAEQRLRIPLPNYQFDRQRHWFEPVKSASGNLVEELSPDQPLPRKSDLADWFYEPVWQRTPAPVSVFNPEAEKTTLIFEDSYGLGASLAASLRVRGGHPIVVRSGKRFKQLDTSNFEINMRSATDYSTLITTLTNMSALPSRIYHMLLVTDSKSYDAVTLQDRGLFSLLFLTQALGELDEGAISIVVVSDGIQRVSDEANLVPAKATVLGPCHVIPREYPDINVRSVDIRLPAAHSPAWSNLCDMLIAEIGENADTAELVAYRASERWTRSFSPAPRTEITAPCPISTDCRPKQEGVYLITGGLGGLGLEIASHLAQTCSARLALMIRTPLPPRSQWQEIMARSNTDPIAQKIRKILAIEAAGGEILLLLADVCNQRAVHKAIQEIKRTWGPIDGVFHTAGILDDSLLEMKSRVSIERVLAPKLHGTLALHNALAKENPDFILLYSSISAFAGLPGQADYAAANTFLDAYAQSRRNDQTSVISVGWSRWQDVGMAADPSHASGDNRGLEMTAQGKVLNHPFLDTLHRVSASEVIVDAELSPDRHWLLDEHRLASGEALIPGTGYLELARAAFNAFEVGPCELGEILFLTPFTVENGKDRQLRIHFVLVEQGQWAFTILGKDKDSSSWTEHVRGTVSRLSSDVEAPLNLIKIQQECEHKGDPASLTDASSLMHFGPRWHSVQELHFGADAALLELKIAEEFESDFDGIGLHPALLDFATAGAQSLIPERVAGQDFFAPASYTSIRMHAPLPKHIFSYIHCRPSVASHVAVFDITIIAPDGSILAEIEEFTMMRLSDTAQLTSVGTSTTSTIPVAAPIANDNPESLVSREGLAIIERVLSGPRASHLVIAPTDLNQTLARLRAPIAPLEREDDEDNTDPPATSAERIIAEIWSEMLGVRNIRRSDDFFDLGGHSLLGVQFMNRLRKRTGKQLPLATLLETSTVEKLGFLIAPNEVPTPAGKSEQSGLDVANTSNRQVVTIRAGTGKTPLFLIHDGLGETLLYRSLAMRIDADRPVLGIEPGRTPSGSYAHTSISEMATAYIERMQSVQPKGPYLVAGLCAGGVLAFEVAQQLQDKGETTAFVGIIDAADVEARKKSFHVTRSRIQRLKSLLNGDTPGVSPTLGSVAKRAYNAVSYEISHRIEMAQRTRTVAQMSNQNDNEASHTDTHLENLSFLQLYEVAHQAHRPKGLFDRGEVVLFKATAGTGADDDVPYIDLYTDCIFGWGKRVESDIIAISIPGGHTSCLQEPNVEVLAQSICDAITRAVPEEFIQSSQTPNTNNLLVAQ